MVPIEEVEVQLPIGDLGITFEGFPVAITEIKNTSPMLRHGLYVGMMVDTVRIGRHTTYYEMTPEKLSENLIHYRNNKNTLFEDEKCMIRFVAPHYVVTPPPIPKLVNAKFQQKTGSRNSTIFDHDNISVISCDNGDIVKNVSEDNTAPEEDDASDKIVKTRDKNRVLQVKKIQPSQSKDEVVPQISFDDDDDGSLYAEEKSVSVDNIFTAVTGVVVDDEEVENKKPYSSSSTPLPPVKLSMSRRQKSAPNVTLTKKKDEKKVTLQRQNSTPISSTKKEEKKVTIPTLKYPTYQRQSSAPTSSNYAKGRAYATTTKPVLEAKSEKLRNRFNKKRVTAVTHKVTSSIINTEKATTNTISTADAGEWV